MNRPGSARYVVLLLAAAGIIALSAPPSYAGHEGTYDCYYCHRLKGGETYSESHSIWTGAAIGEPTYSAPIRCDWCHTDMGGGGAFGPGPGIKSAHPVRTIDGNGLTVQSPTISDLQASHVLDCRDCHNGNQSSQYTLSPDLVPSSYTPAAATDTTDGYPDHDTWGPRNDNVYPAKPHLTSMLWDNASSRSLTGAAVPEPYDNASALRSPSSNPASDYAFCLSCHDGSNNTTRAVTKGVNIRNDYVNGKGHYFKSAAPTGGALNDRIPCLDCHGAHSSGTSSRLMAPNFSSGSWPGVIYDNATNPSAGSIRAMCVACHDDAGAGTNGTPRVRGVEPSRAPATVSAHITYTGSKTTEACTQCHNPHNPPGGGPDCLTCHTAGGAAGSAYDYIDALFKGVGFDGAAKPVDALPLSWSQHGGFNGSTANFVYTTPYNTKALNDCFKCHGERHTNPYALIDADTGGSDTYAFNPAVGMNDNTASGIANANAFCLTCHDGNGAAGDVQIGNQVPPNMAGSWSGSGSPTLGGHGVPTTSVYSVSLNPGAGLKCIDCHEVHGSNHAKLLPAKKDAPGNFTIPSAMPEKSFRSGASTLPARNIDFTDYTAIAGTPSGQGFGTAGDPGDQRDPSGSSTGLCDACHRFAGRANGGTDNVTNVAHTHEGIAGQGNPVSQMNFAKDCLECHDVHGTTNLEMVRTTINTYSVTFTARTGANSFDPAESGSDPNVNSVCVVCHQSFGENGSLNVDHSFRTSTVNPDHNEGANCTSCHPHGNAASANKFGFPEAACNSCHGAPADASGMPATAATGDTGVYHTDANPVLGTRGGDNTAHKIHVNYLVNKRGKSPADSCKVCHMGGGGQETHPENPAGSDSFKTESPSAAYVDIALDNTGAVLNVQLPGRIAAYGGTVGQPAGVANGWKTCNNTTCHYAESPSWSGKTQAAAGTLTVGSAANLPAGGSLASPSDNNYVERIDLVASGGAVTVSSLKVRETGSASDGSDIGAVRFYLDANNDNVADSPTPLGGGNATYASADTSYTVSGLSLTVPSGSTHGVLVKVDIPSGATNGDTVIVAGDNASFVASDASGTTYNAFASATFTIQSGGTLTVGSTANNPAGGNVPKPASGTARHYVEQLELAASGGDVTVSSIKVRETGTARDVTVSGSGNDEINAVYLFLDANRDGVADTPASPLGGVAATYANGDTSYTLGGLNLSIPSGQTYWVLVTMDILSASDVGDTLVTQVDNGAIVASQGAVNSFSSFNSATFTIQVAGALTVDSLSNNPAGGSISQGTTGNYVEQIRMAASAGGPVQVTSLKVKQTGTASDTSDIAAVKFYLDSNADGTAESTTPLGGGSATFSGADNTYTVSNLLLNVPAGTTYWALVKVDIAAGATSGDNVATQVNNGYVTAGAGTVNAITTFNSAAFTIGTNTLQQVVVSNAQYPSAGYSTPVNTTNVKWNGTKQYYAAAQWSLTGWADATTDANYTWSRSGTATGSTVGANSGLYTAGTTPGTDNVRIQHNTLGVWDNTAATVMNFALVISGTPGGGALASDSVNTTASKNYYATVTWDNTSVDDLTQSSSWSFVTNNSGGTLNNTSPNKGLYTAGATGGVTDTIKSYYLADTAGHNDNLAITVNAAAGPWLTNGHFDASATGWALGGTHVFTWNSGNGYTGDSGHTTGYLAGPAGAKNSTRTSTADQTLAQSIPTGASTTIRFAYSCVFDADVIARAFRAYYFYSDAPTTPVQVYALTSPTVDGTWRLVSQNVTVPSGKSLVGVRVEQTIQNQNANPGNGGNNHIDGVSIAYSSNPPFAPPRATGDNVTYRAACDTCHQFGPRDDTLDASGHPTGADAGSNPEQYLYPAQGDHIKHGAGDPQNWNAPAPAWSDGTAPPFRYACSVCHGNLSGYGTDHADGTKFLNSGQIGFAGTGTGTWNGGPRTCSNVNCHANAATPAWGSGTANCTSCHNNGTADGQLANSAPNSGKHAAHIAANPAYVNDCASCHGANANTGGHTGHVAGSPSFGGSLASYNSGNKTCTNACHLAGNNAWDAAGTLACTDCHQGSYIGEGALPVSGLHAITPTVSGVRHDNTLTSCATCHSGILALGTHVNGAFFADNVSNTDRGLFGAWTDNTPGTCSGGGAIAAGCHDGTGEGAGWRRRWSATAANTDGTECANCHGGLGANDWTFGTGAHASADNNVEHGYDWDGNNGSEVIGNHLGNTDQTNKCNTCHGYPDSPYNTTPIGWQPRGTSTYHGNNQIEMNSTMGYSSSAFNCTSTCHFGAGGNTNHNLEDSGWTVASVAGPALACDSCHGGGGRYWPQAGGTAYPKRPGEHQPHIDNLAARLGYGATPTDTQQKHLCKYCHTYTTAPGESGHDDGVSPANVGDFNPIWSTQDPPVTTDNGTYAPGDGTNGTCSSVDCHNNKSTTTAFDWYDGAASVCAMCHTNVTATGTPTGNTHVAHDNADLSFGINVVCANCHDAATNWSTNTAPASNHINGTFAVSGNVAFTYTGTYPTTFGSCGTNNCHNNGKNAAPRDNTYTWGTAIAGCGACHGDTSATLVSEAHPEHLTASSTFGLSISCGHCHTVETAATHVNQYVTFGGSVSFTYTGDNAITGSTFGSCGTNTCHRSSATGGAPAVDPYNWNTTQPNCSICHIEAMATNKHAQHLGSNSLPNAAVNECYVCHDTTATSGGLATGSAHLNSANDLAFNATYNYETLLAGRAGGSGATTTCSNVLCHNGVTTPQWNGTVTCGSCHNTTSNGPLPSASSVAGGHSSHANNDATYTDCDGCHGNATYNVSGSRGASAYTATGGGGASPNGIHQNLVVNLYVNGGSGTYSDTDGRGGVNYVNGTENPDIDDGTCGTTACHGGGTPTWGGTLTGGCFACHDTNGATVDENAGVLGGAANGSPNEVDNVQWLNRGHGRTTAYTSKTGGTNNNGANLSCYSTDPSNPVGGCHQPAAQHAPTSVATDPWRVVGSGTNWANTTSATDGLNGLCLSCHDGVTAVGGVQTHHDAITGETVLLHKQKCVDCHDPHGDTNIYMVHGKVAQDSNDDGVSSSTYGVPESTVSTTFSSFNPGGNSSDLDTLANTDGLCEVCHVGAQTTAHNGNAGDPGHGTSSYQGQDCTGCHKHNEGFKGSGCSGCHGGGTSGSVSANFWPDSSNARTENTAGVHPAHINALAKRFYGKDNVQILSDASSDTLQKQLCAWCHPDPANPNVGNPTWNSVHNNGTRNLNGSAANHFGNLWDNYAQPWSGLARDADGTWSGTSQVSITCSNIDCHYSTTTPDWYGGASPTCSICHRNSGATEPWTDLGGDGAGDHFRHDAAITISTGVNDSSKCFICHNGYVPTFDNITWNSGASHINNNRQNNAFPQAYSRKNYNSSSPLGSYSGTDNGTCSNVNCHGSVVTPAWRTGRISTATVSNANCMSTCHYVQSVGTDNEYQSARSGKHLSHISAGKTCDNCHSSAPTNHYGVLGDNTMINPNNIAPNGTGTYTDTTTSGPPFYSAGGTSGSCSNIAGCHANANWDPTAAGGCAFCHSSNQTKSGGGGSYTYRVVAGSTGDYNLASHHITGITNGNVDPKDCSQCHWEGNPGTGARTDYHTNVGSNLGPYTINLRIWTGTSPPSVYTVGTTALEVNPISPPAASGFTDFCLGCHNAANAATDIFYGAGGSQTQKPTDKSWDGNAIASKYNNAGTTAFGKFNSANYNVNPKNTITKALSPHGNINANQGGYAITGNWANRRTAFTKNVPCMDCHNAHGSPVSFTWWKTPASPTTVTGGNPRTVPVNTGSSYMAAAGTGYPANADFCWDCHYGEGGASGHTYTEYGTYSQKIGMFREHTSTGPSRWTGTWVSSFSFKNGSMVSDHFNIYANNSNPVSAAMSTTPRANTVTIGCSGCHDPHGVSSSQTNANFMVPALKGTWITNPYKEDRPPRSDYDGTNILNDFVATSVITMVGDPRSGTSLKDPDVSWPGPRANPDWYSGNIVPGYNIPKMSGEGMGNTLGYQPPSGKFGFNGYFIDENTFGFGTGVTVSNPTPGQATPGTPKRMTDIDSTYTDAKFAGLCLVCHPKADIQGIASTDGRSGFGGGSITTHPHYTVSGWGTGVSWDDILTSTITGTGWSEDPKFQHGMGSNSYSDWSNYAADGVFGPQGMDRWNGSSLSLTADVSTTVNYAHRYRWGVTVANQAQAEYHKFPCSKCHTPHVSRLPRLMLTNCLDNRGTTKTDFPKTLFLGPGGSTKGDKAAAYGVDGSAETSTAVGRNVVCHSTNRGTGWNRMTPW